MTSCGRSLAALPSVYMVSADSKTASTSFFEARETVEQRRWSRPCRSPGGWSRSLARCLPWRRQRLSNGVCSQLDPFCQPVQSRFLFKAPLISLPPLLPFSFHPRPSFPSFSPHRPPCRTIRWPTQQLANQHQAGHPSTTQSSSLLKVDSATAPTTATLSVPDPSTLLNRSVSMLSHIVTTRKTTRVNILPSLPQRSPTPATRRLLPSATLLARKRSPTSALGSSSAS